MWEMSGEVEKKTPKKEMDNPLFLLRHMDIFDTILAQFVNTLMNLSLVTSQPPISPRSLQCTSPPQLPPPPTTQPLPPPMLQPPPPPTRLPPSPPITSQSPRTSLSPAMAPHTTALYRYSYGLTAAFSLYAQLMDIGYTWIY